MADLGELGKLIDLMVARGVRRVRTADVEVELDPAAQLLNAAEPEQEQSASPEDKKAAGLCPFKGCDRKGGYLRQQFCATHFGVALSGRVS
jgi:hypothetical protein